ncbi:MAG: hypothetical protein K6347_02285 [Campylobacterales bacterium]
MIDNRAKYKLKDMLFKRYQKLVLSFDQVQKEILDNPALVNSTSIVPNTWLIDDVVSFLCHPYDNSKNKQAPVGKSKKQLVIEHFNKELESHWRARKIS